MDVPRWHTFWKSYEVVGRTQPEAVFYNLSMKGLAEPWQAYNVHVTRLDGCKEGDHFGLMKFESDWANDATYRLIGPNVTTTMTAMLQTPRPPGDDVRNPEVHLYLNPSCQFKVEVQANLPSMWGQIVRFYATLVPSMTMAACLLTVVQQLKLLAKDGQCPSFLSVVTTRVTPISVVLPSKILSAALGAGFAARYAPVTDLARLQEEGVDFGVLPIILFFVCIGLVTVISAAAWACVVVFGRAVNKAATRSIAAAVPAAGEMVADAAFSGLSKVGAVFKCPAVPTVGQS